ncbi:hypothetical protein KFL_001500240 [Klebsormidium nitens]|uniref:Uncharacterized protein n=1 Tax=Klebsormidium nitens TaxID=105231 RepID=A0A1Y1HXW0_KLENI|nr:hypothetical protein KFL_001500240 [Klebsormidium nitens]|eukprot:GAQ83494.1 hypothetical protein KFL_001500240 [Klebsormidium nitens]
MFSMFSIPGNGAVRKGLAVQQSFLEDLSAPVPINRKARPSFESVAWSEAWNADATMTYDDIEREEDLEAAERALEDQDNSERSASEIDWPLWVRNALHEPDAPKVREPNTPVVREHEVSGQRQPIVQSAYEPERTVKEERPLERTAAVEKGSTEEAHETVPEKAQSQVPLLAIAASVGTCVAAIAVRYLTAASPAKCLELKREGKVCRRGIFS